MIRSMSKEFSPMGRVAVQVKIENFTDLALANGGVLGEEDVRSVVVEDALIDTGATAVSLPTRMIEELGLKEVETRRVRTAAGVIEATLYSAVRLSVQGRWCTVDVMQVPNEIPVLIGQVPLEIMDFVVDPASRTLIANPRHDGEWMMEAYAADDSEPPGSDAGA